MSLGADFTFDFFISRRGSAAAVATEVADVLEREGYRVRIQDYDFARGGDFVADIHDALTSARHLIVLHTQDYDQSYWTKKEFTNFLALLPESKGTRRLCMLRCDESFPRGILANIVFGDYVGVADAEARRQIILATAKGEAAGIRRAPPLFGGSIPNANAHFTGRAEVLAEITDLARANLGSSALLAIVICGLAGTGKTSLARACVEALAPDYPGVWWINAQARQNLLGGLAAFAARLDPALAQEDNVEKAARAALARVERSERPFLMVYDNVDHPGDVDDLMPARGAHVIVTSRRGDWHGRAHEVGIGGMAEADAIAFLQARAGRKDENGARKLAQMLDCLPLALDHAGAYIRLSMSSFAAYAKGIDKLLAKAPRDAPYPASVAATFNLAIDNAVKECTGADIVLGHLAYFAPERIPLDLLPEELAGGADLGDAIAALSDVSLIRADPIDEDCPGVAVHRLVQAAARLRLAERGAEKAILQQAIGAIDAAFPEGAHEDIATWPRCGQLLSHAMALREHVAVRKAPTPAAPVLFDRVGHYLHGRAMFDHAEIVFRDAIAFGEAALGPDEPQVAKSKNNLANVLCATGRRRDAEALFRDALRVHEEKLGRTDPGCARVMTSLALLLADTGHAEEAETLLREALESGRVALGPHHPEVVVRINNLAMLMQRAGCLGEAETLFREAIAAGERTIGRCHPMVLSRLSNLAVLLLARGRPGEAEPLLRECVTCGVDCLGQDHLDVAKWRNNLANLLRDRAQYDEAEPLYVDAVATSVRVLGAQHEVTGRFRRNLAVLQLATGKAGDALENAKAALAAHEIALGRDHAWTRDSACAYADALDRVTSNVPT